MRPGLVTLALLAAVGATAAHAQSGPRAGTAQMPPDARIPWVSGGVGEQGQARMQSLADEGYTMQLVFAEQGTGAYVADVHVQVADASGRVVIDGVAEGPAFFAKLPQGDYKVALQYRGHRQTRTVRATPRGNRTVIHWPAEAGSAPAPASTRAPQGPGPDLATPPAGSSAAPRR